MKIQTSRFFVRRVIAQRAQKTRKILCGQDVFYYDFYGNVETRSRLSDKSALIAHLRDKVCTLA